MVEFPVDVVGQVEELLLDVLAEQVKGFACAVRVDPVGADRVCLDLIEGQWDGGAVPGAHVEGAFGLGANYEDRCAAVFGDEAGAAFHDAGGALGAVDGDAVCDLRICFHVVDHVPQYDLAFAPAAEDLEVVIFEQGGDEAAQCLGIREGVDMEGAEDVRGGEDFLVPERCDEAAVCFDEGCEAMGVVVLRLGGEPDETHEAAVDEWQHNAGNCLEPASERSTNTLAHPL